MADARERAQVQPILDQLGAEPWPLNWAAEGNTVSFICRQGALLTRSADARRTVVALTDVFAGFGDDQDPQIVDLDGAGDLVSVEWQVSPDPGLRARYAVPEILSRLELDPRVARPDHVLYVCGHPCPADEPVVQEVGTPVTSGFVDPCPAGQAPDGSGRKLFLVDTGIDAATVAMHPWLTGVVGEPDTGVTGGGQILKYGGHGTFSAGCARVTAPACDIWVAEALPRATAADYESNVAAAIDRVLDDQGIPDVLLVCFASATYHDEGLPAFDDLYRRRLHGLTGTAALLAPAGNDEWSTPMFPAAYPWFTSVGALDAHCDDRADYSNYGWWVDVWAPGTDLVNAFPVGTYTCDEPENVDNGVPDVRDFTGLARWSGTSFATPLVAGMVLSRAQADNISGAEAMRVLLAEACWPDGPQEGPRLIP